MRSVRIAIAVLLLFFTEPFAYIQNIEKYYQKKYPWNKGFAQAFIGSCYFENDGYNMMLGMTFLPVQFGDRINLPLGLNLAAVKSTDDYMEETVTLSAPIYWWKYIAILWETGAVFAGGKHDYNPGYVVGLDFRFMVAPILHLDSRVLATLHSFGHDIAPLRIYLGVSFAPALLDVV